MLIHTYLHLAYLHATWCYETEANLQEMAYLMIQADSHMLHSNCIKKYGFFSTITTTREQTLERYPNLALASAFFAPGTKGPFSPGS